MTLLMTGADGELGRALCRQLLHDGVSVVALLHANNQQQFVRREQNLRARLTAEDIKHADLRCYALDLDQEQAFADLPADLAERIHGIIHCAGRTRFDISLDVAMRSNVHGSRQLFQWAKGCDNLERLTVLGSCYSSGLRQGTIHETIGIAPPAWANAYEQSKFLVEEDLARSGLPWVLLRPATSICAEENGRVERHGVVHQCLRLLHLGLLAVCPGHADVTIPLTSSAFVADATWRAHTQTPVHSILHACPPPDSCLGLPAILQIAHECFLHDEAYRHRRVRLPPLVDLERWQDLARARCAFGAGILGASLQALEPFAPQLACKKSFSVDQARRFGLVDRQAQAQLLTAVCRNLLDTQFGKKPKQKHQELKLCR